MKQYAGVCYDGPYEGKHCASETRSFYLARYNGEPVLNPDSRWPLEIRTGRYRWSAPLRKWVFES